MILSNQPGRSGLSDQVWAQTDNDWLIERGYPVHTAQDVARVNAGTIPLTIHGSLYSFADHQAVPQTQPQPAEPPTWQHITGLTPAPPTTITASEIIAGMKVKAPQAKSKNPNKLYNIPLWEAFRGRLSGSKQEGEVGLEIEAEGMNLFSTPVSWWVTHQDGSLRAVKDHPPIEYVLRKPVSRKEVPQALSYLSKKLKESGSSIVESHRTSVHVHVNCQELTVKQIYQYWCLYTIFEEMLVDFSGPDRPGNLFCLSSKQAEYAVNCLEQAIQTENFNEVFSDNLRYTSCNTASLGKFGSLEFRSMRGTVDQDLIQVWVDILLLLKDKALEYECPRSIVEEYTRLGPEAFLNKTFDTRSDIRAIFLSRPLIERNKSLWEGLRLMKDVAYAIVWDKRIPEDKKKSQEKEPDPVVSVRVDPEGHEIIDATWVHPNVCAYTLDNGHTHLYNFSFGPYNTSLEYIGVPTVMGPREVYRYSNSGQFMYTIRTLEEDEGPY